MTTSVSPSRRGVLLGIGASVLPLPLRAAPRSRDVPLYAGGYDREGGDGVLPLGYDPADETWRTADPVTEAVDASFGVRGTTADLHYLVQEGQAGMVSTYRVAGGTWRRLSYLSTKGADPCHLALDRTQSALAVANYTSGSIILYRLDRATGLPVDQGALHVHHGSGPNRERQESAHAHWVGFTPDNRWLRAVDLGADTIFAYPFDAAAGRLGAATVAYRAPAGSGPRHLAFHPTLPRAYLVSELANSLTVLRTGPDATLAAIATLPTLPTDYRGASQAGAIAINRAGTRVYVSNRGHDSIAAFAIGRDGGATLLQHVACGGHWPRYIHVMDAQARLLVANERSGTIATFAIASDGRLRSSGSGVSAPGVAFVGTRG